jgi:hypothetical protein
MDDTETLKLDKDELTVTPLSAQSGDKAYWLARSPYERLLAVETLRQLNYGHDKSTARIQRVIEVAQLASE